MSKAETLRRRTLNADDFRVLTCAEAVHGCVQINATLLLLALKVDYYALQKSCSRESKR